MNEPIAVLRSNLTDTESLVKIKGIESIQSTSLSKGEGGPKEQYMCSEVLTADAV